MSNVIKPDFKAKRRRAEMLKRQAKREEMLYKLKPYLELCVVVLTVGTLLVIINAALGLK